MNLANTSKKRSAELGHETDFHPLDLPPEERARFLPARLPSPSASRTSSSHQFIMDTNADSSRPTTPATSDEKPTSNGTNGVNGTHPDDQAPQPPPHKTPSDAPPKKSEAELKAEAEAAKEEGNKFFKAKQYDQAISQYTKGRDHSTISTKVSADNFSQLSRPTLQQQHTDRIEQLHTCPRTSSQKL